jgi:hypothetical protein
MAKKQPMFVQGSLFADGSVSPARQASDAKIIEALNKPGGKVFLFAKTGEAGAYASL